MEGGNAEINPDKRFGVNEVSKERLNEFRGLTAAVAEKNSWFVGNTIIGSMALGSAHEESDIDAHWFYDSSKMGESVVTENLSPRELEFNEQDKDRKRVAAMNKITKDVRTLSSEYLKDGSAEQYFADLLQSPDMLIHDLNPQVINDIIKRYGNAEYADETDFNLATSSSELYALKYIFLANVGDNPSELNKYRTGILDQLKETTHGQRIFQRVIRDIGEIERPADFGRTAYAHYPQTIDAAYQYFRLPPSKTTSS